MSTIAIIQARLGSTRLPGKVLKPLVGRPILDHVVTRVRAAHRIDRVVVATSDLPTDEPIRAFCAETGFDCFAGNETDVLDRFYQAGLAFGAEILVRITADCPMTSPELIDAIVAFRAEGGYDHAGLATGAGALHLAGVRFPNGVDAECLRFEALAEAWREAIAPTDREHVTPFLWRQPERYRLGVLKSPRDYSHLRWVVDNAEDYAVVSAYYEALFREDRLFTYEEALAHAARHPELARMNTHLIGREGHAAVWAAEGGTDNRS